MLALKPLMPTPVLKNPKTYILNCAASSQQGQDWSFDDAVNAGVINSNMNYPATTDLRRPWWGIDDQGDTGTAVGHATAYGVLRWHYVKANKIANTHKPSMHFINIANREQDSQCNFPSSFLEMRGMQLKSALKIARNYGCVLETDMSLDGRSSYMSAGAFYSRAARLRIASYHNLGINIDHWCQWLAFQGPILAKINVDESWDHATQNNGNLAQFLPSTVRGSHAICIVGYDSQGFVLRNCWGRDWGKQGFAYGSYDYMMAAVNETYGVVV